MHVLWQTRTSSVIQSHRTGKFQTSDSVSQTCCISVCAVGSFAPTKTLSRNCASDRVLPRIVVHRGWPWGENVRVPMRRIKSMHFLAPQTDRRSALWALKGPPIGMAPVRAQNFPDAWAYVSVRSEK